MLDSEFFAAKYFISEQTFSIHHINKKGSYTMPEPHYHPFYEIYYLLQGERSYFINDSVYTVNKGDLVLINPYELHRTDNKGSTAAGFERILINFAHDFVEKILPDDIPLLPFGKENRLIRIPLKEQPAVEALLWEMIAESRGKSAGHTAYVRSLLTKLLVRIYRCRSHDEPKQEELHNPIHRKISEIALYLSDHYKEKPALPDVARAFFISPSYLSRLFKEVTGFHFREYLLLLRLREAQEQLREKSAKVTDIAMSCGFENIAHFNKAFKKMIGISPLQYRKIIQEKGS